MRDTPRFNQRQHAFHNPSETDHQSNEQCQRLTGHAVVAHNHHAAKGQQNADEHVQHTPAARQTRLHESADDAHHAGNHEIHAEQQCGQSQRLVRHQQQRSAQGDGGHAHHAVNDANLGLGFFRQPFLDQAEWTEIADIPVGLLPAGLTLIAPWTIRLPVRLAIRLAVRLIPPTVRPPCRLAVRAIVRIVGVRAVVRVLVRSALWLAVLRLLILSVLRSRRALRRILAAMIAVIRAILRLARRIRLARLALVGLARLAIPLALVWIAHRNSLAQGPCSDSTYYDRQVV